MAEWESGAWPRRIGCVDPFGRARAFTVFFTETGRIALSAPAGEVGVLTSAQIRALKETLDAAQVELLTRRIT